MWASHTTNSVPYSRPIFGIFLTIPRLGPQGTSGKSDHLISLGRQDPRIKSLLSQFLPSHNSLPPPQKVVVKKCQGCLSSRPEGITYLSDLPFPDKPEQHSIFLKAHSQFTFDGLTVLNKYLKASK